MVLDAPIAYQDIGGVRRQVAVQPGLRQGGEFGFEVTGEYDRSKALVIDPIISWATYLGGSDVDVASGIAVDAAGNAYVTGLTWGPSFPTSNGLQPVSSGTGFITKLNAAGDQLIYTTFVGDSVSATQPAIAVDLAGNAYITGGLDIPYHFPVTDGAFKTTPDGNQNTYVTKVGAAGDVLLYSTYLAGSSLDNEAGFGIAVDPLGCAYVVGQTRSTSFPVTPGAFQSSMQQGSNPGFIAKLNPQGSGLVYASYFDEDAARSVALDQQGNAYVAGNGGPGVFVAKVNTTGTALTYSTHLASAVDPWGIAVDRLGRAWVTGIAFPGFPTTAGAYQASFPTGAYNAAFVAALNPTGSALDVSTYLGGSTGGGGPFPFIETQGLGIAVDSKGRPTVVGWTNTDDFPTLNAFQSTRGGSWDCFVTRLTTTGALDFSSYYGGSLADDARGGVALDPRGNIYLSGRTDSADLPGTDVPGTVQPNFAGWADAFVAKIQRVPKAPKINTISPDTGFSSTDRITNAQNLTISGTAQPNVTVSLERADVGVLGSVQANSSGNWSYNYTATTLPEGTYDFLARAGDAEGKSDYSPGEFLVTVDRTPPNVSLIAPASTSSLGPEVRIVARDLIGVPANATVTLDMDFNNDGTFTDPGELSYAQGQLSDGQATIKLPTLPGPGTYAVRVRVTDLAGNEGTSLISTIVVNSVTSAWTATARILSVDPVMGDWQTQLGDVSLVHELDLDRSPHVKRSGSSDATQSGSADPKESGTTDSNQNGSADSNQSGSPALVYHSSSVSQRPIVQVSLPSANNGALPSTITAQLIFDGITQASPVTFDTTGFAPGDVFTFALQADQTITATGRYGYSVLVQVLGQADQTVTGSTFVVAQDASALGAGWGFAGVDRLVAIAADTNGPAGMLRVYGTGGYRFYQGTSTFSSPADDNGTLTLYGGTYTYATPDGQAWTFNSNGRQTGWTSADGKETLAYSYDGSGRMAGLTAIDGALTTFTYNAGAVIIQTVNSRTTTLTLDGSGNLAAVTNPDTGVRTFTYDNAHKLTREQFGLLENNWEYASTGVVGTYTWGAASAGGIANQSQATYTPAVTRGISALTSGTVFASTTDPTGHTDSAQLDATGKSLQHAAPDGALTQYNYSNGYLASQTDPLGRTTTYVRDAAGYVTQLTQPGGSLVTFQYQSAFHALTTMVNELGAAITLSYDSAGHLIGTTDAVGNHTTYNYDAATGLLASQVDPRGGTTTYQYDSARRLTRTVDPLGNATTYTYDSNGNRATTTDALGHVTTAAFDAMGRPTSVTDALGYVTTITYDASGLVLTSTDPTGTKRATDYDSFKRGLVSNDKDGVGSGTEVGQLSSYDAAGRKIGYRDAAGWSSSAKYDPDGRIIETVDPLGNTKDTVWDAVGEKIAERDELGRWTYYSYDVRGNQTQVKDNLGNVTTTSYDLGGNITAKTDALGHTTGYQYDADNRKTVETDPLGRQKTTIYDANGNVSSVTDPLGRVTSYAYDALNRKTQETNAVGTAVARTRQTAYDAVGNVHTTTDALGNVTTYSYNALNRRTVVLDPLNHSVTATYNAAGKPVTSTDSLGKVTTYSYDALHRQTGQTDPLNHATTAVLDANGNPAASIDAQGNVTSVAIDALGRPTGSQDNAGGFSFNLYDGAGGVRQVVDPQGNEWDYVQDRVGRQTVRIDPLGAATYSAYDAAGRMTSVTDRDGRVIQFSYDVANQVTSAVWKDATGATVNVVTYSYDNAGKRLTDTDYAGAVTYTYDELNRVKTYTNVFGQLLTYTYDAEDRAIQRADSLGGVQTSTYNAVGLLTSRQFSGSGQTPVRVDIGYTARYEQSSITRYADLAGTILIATSLFTNDDAGHLTSIVNKDNTGATLSSYGYAYDSADRTTSQTWSSQVNTVPYSGSRTYTYDLAGELHSDGTTNYSYDFNGNRTMTGYDTGPGNRITTDGVFTYSYDNEGNIVQKTKGTGQETWYFGYDNANHLTSVRKTSDGTTTVLLLTYTYDVEGNRVKEQSWGGSGPAETRFAYDGANIWADLDSNNAVTVRRMFGDRPDQLLTRMVVSGPNAGLWLYLTDAQGSVRDLVNANSQIKAHLDYDGYGVRTDPQSSVSDRYGYTGREWQADSGIQHNRHRDYLPALGKWMQEDPISFSAGDFNVTRYVRNNPVNRSDPSGLLCGLDLAVAYLNGVDWAADAYFATGDVDDIIAGFYIGFTVSLIESAFFPWGCFTGDMQVLTSRGWVRWDNLTVEDAVAARDEFNPDGPIGFKRVEEIFNTTAVVCHVHVAGQVIRTTGQHPFWVRSKGWVGASALQSGDLLASHDGQWVAVEEVFDTGTTEVLYNCRIADYHTYFVGGEDWSFSVWAHNKCEGHHLLPQAEKLKAFFGRALINIEHFVVWVETALHRLKPDGLHTILGGNWNKQWREFMNKFPDASAEEILDKLAKMLMDLARRRGL